jgi:hypothetical protein
MLLGIQWYVWILILLAGALLVRVKIVGWIRLFRKREKK